MIEGHGSVDDRRETGKVRRNGVGPYVDQLSARFVRDSRTPWSRRKLGQEGNLVKKEASLA